MSPKLPILCIDLQNDFASQGGRSFVQGTAVGFLLNDLFPFLRERSLMVSEIISDYRQPRPGDDRDCCRPGEWGYSSLLPSDLRKSGPWVKCMNYPIWTRDGIGDPSAVPGEPYQDPWAFGKWLTDSIGSRERIDSVVLVGLTADCCVLSTVQELRWRGYRVQVLMEGTDVRSGDQDERERFLSRPPFTFWGEVVRWEDLKGHIG